MRPSRVSAIADLLQHVVIEVTLVGRIQRQTGCLHLALDCMAVMLVDGQSIMNDIGHITILEKDEATGFRNQRRHVGGNQHLVFGDTDYQRAAAACRDQATRLVLADDAERKGAFKIGNRRLHRAEQVLALVEVVVNLMHDYLGIGLRVTADLLLFAKFVVVFDDAVVDQRHALVTDMRMRVLLTRNSVRGPAGMRDAGHAADRILLQCTGQLGDLADLAYTFQQCIITLHRHTGRIITAVFQPAQAIDQHRDHVTRRYYTDYAAHKSLPCLSRRVRFAHHFRRSPVTWRCVKRTLQSKRARIVLLQYISVSFRVFHGH